MRKKIHKALYTRSEVYARFMDRFKLTKVPWLGGIPVYLFFKIFIRNLMRENISLKASSVAFNLFLSLIPALIFLFTLIPYFPMQDVKQEIMLVLSSLLPYNAFETIDETLQDILNNPRGNLLSIGLLMALYFASNGVFSLMETFNKYDKRGFFHKRVIAMLLTLGLGAIFLVDLTLLLVGQLLIKFILNYLHIGDTFIYYTGVGAQWFMMFLLIFAAYTLLYYFGEYKKERWAYIFPGSFVATLFTLLTSSVYGYYVETWSNSNMFYGSFGTLIITMLWLYFNSIMLIAGYEFNLSIKHTHRIVSLQKSAEPQPQSV
jgi:membrane protein